MSSLSGKKKLLFAAIPTVLLLGGLVAGEIAYRRHLGIPVLGGKIRDADLFTPGRDGQDRFRGDACILANASSWRSTAVRRTRFCSTSRVPATPPGRSRSTRTVSATTSTHSRNPPGRFVSPCWATRSSGVTGLALEDSFPKQLERLLNERLDRPFEVLNFAVSGYSTMQEVELFRDPG